MKKEYSNREMVRGYILGVPLNEEEKVRLETFAKKQGLTKAGFARMVLMREIEEMEG